MRKNIGKFLILFSLLLATWFIGSCILIQIDHNAGLQEKRFQRFLKRENLLKQNIDKYCKDLDKADILKASQQSYDNRLSVKEQQKKEALELWERAKKEKIIRENLIYFPQLKQMWCLVPKAASTSWSEAIVDRLNNEMKHVDPSNSTDSLQVILKKKFGMIDKTTFVEAGRSDKVKKVLLIRHPFSRIASAYQNKLADRKAKTDGMHFYQQFGARMNRKYRESNRKKVLKQREPTFQEFVDYLVDTKPQNYNEHWQPISLLCGLCHIRYDHIIMAEDLEETSDFHLEVLEFPKGFKLSVSNRNEGGVNQQLLFKNISSTKKVKLLQKYQDDFRLFGYRFFGSNSKF